MMDPQTIVLQGYSRYVMERIETFILFLFSSWSTIGLSLEIIGASILIMDLFIVRKYGIGECYLKDPNGKNPEWYQYTKEGWLERPKYFLTKRGWRLLIAWFLIWWGFVCQLIGYR